MDKDEIITRLLERELVEAMGCTEPAACALAAAKAAELLEGEPEYVKASVSRDVVKNAMGVNIPGFHRKGAGAAIALGIAIHDSSLGLNILAELSAEQKEYADNINVHLELAEDTPSLYISVFLRNHQHSSRAVISDSHTHFSYLEKNGCPLLEEHKETTRQIAPTDECLGELGINDIIDYSERLPKTIEDLMLNAIRTNLEIAKESLRDHYGLEIGRTMIKKCNNPPQTVDDAMKIGAVLAAGGSDARMAGCQLPVVVNSGSGNQGLTLTVPIAVVADFLKKSDRETAVSVCIAELTGLVMTALKGRLSAQCGAFTAAIGLGCGLAYLRGGNSATLERVIQNMIGNLTGVVCDGAKMTCALKIHSCVQSACLACELALAGVAPDSGCGIIGEDANATLANLSLLTRTGMAKTDRTILNIMLGNANN